MKGINNVFRDNMVYYMELRHKSQADIARGLNVSTSTVSDWINGVSTPRADRVAALASFFRCGVNDLLMEREQTFEQLLWDNYGVMLRKFGELSEADKQIVVDLAERLGYVGDGRSGQVRYGAGRLENSRRDETPLSKHFRHRTPSNRRANQRPF